ncbi:MAG: glycosyltransferase family 4 protein [Gemmatimonadales bacterium]
MRIAYVCADPGVPVFGRKGCAVHVQELIRAFRARGAHVELFAARVGDVPAPGEDLRIRPLPAVRDGEPVVHARAVTAFNRHLRDALEWEGPYDLIYERYSLWSFAAMEYARATGVPGLLEVNAPLIAEQAAYRGLRDAAGARDAALRAFGAATALIAVSREVAAWLEEYPAARDRVHVVPNGVDPTRFRPDVPPSAPGRPGTFTVGFAGSMKPWHGLDLLLEAFDRLHRHAGDARLLLVGDGPARAAVRADVSARGLAEAVQFAGSVAPDEVPGLLTSMDVAVAPYSEPGQFYFSPLKVYEYLAAGRPVVASRVGQLGTLLRHDDNGLLCAPGDSTALAAALDLLRRDRGLRARLGAAARATVLHDHTWEAVVGRILGLARAHRDVPGRAERVEA